MLWWLYCVFVGGDNLTLSANQTQSGNQRFGELKDSKLELVVNGGNYHFKVQVKTL